MPDGRVLVVDDEREIRATVGEMLSLEGYEVREAANGAEALDALAAFDPHVVLLDMRMPVLDGWGFAAAVKARGLEVPIVVMTAARDAARWAEEISALAALPKPFDFDDLIATVAAARGAA